MKTGFALLAVVGLTMAVGCTASTQSEEPEQVKETEMRLVLQALTRWARGNPALEWATKPAPRSWYRKSGAAKAALNASVNLVFASANNATRDCHPSNVPRLRIAARIAEEF